MVENVCKINYYKAVFAYKCRFKCGQFNCAVWNLEREKCGAERGMCVGANKPPLSSQNFSTITFQEAAADSETLIAFFIKTIESPGEQQPAAAQPWKWKGVILPG